jgi:hypothetical protein
MVGAVGDDPMPRRLLGLVETWRFGVLVRGGKITRRTLTSTQDSRSKTVIEVGWSRCHVHSMA